MDKYHLCKSRVKMLIGGKKISSINPQHEGLSTMRALMVSCMLLVCAHAAHSGTYSSASLNSVYPAQAFSYTNQAFLKAQVRVASASGVPAVFRAPFVNRNGVASRNPDAVWNDPVEHLPLVNKPVQGAELLVYGDPGYGAFRGNFGGLSSNAGLYGYQFKRSARA
ncbi:hypothetical protein BIW11_09102 [Tropilaelaps mercedesae]|uniref:Uncharacterized protein n=1 Tax=Tropilaelaps mercedesae TaxID=418985 RepID=A0A1V9XM27_9ACAR|nr:hypothetical protein BIW11_09102 [Tropilaelaps mercedesae]